MTKRLCLTGSTGSQRNYSTTENVNITADEGVMPCSWLIGFSQRSKYKDLSEKFTCMLLEGKSKNC